MLIIEVFRALVGLQGYGQQEALPEQWERLHDTAAVIVEVAEQTPHPAWTAQLLVAVGKYESRFSASVGRGECAGVSSGEPRCDGGKARSYWQLWQVSCPELWELKAGSRAALHQAATCASRLLWSGYRACLKRAPSVHATARQRLAWLGSLSRYAVGHGCYWSGARQRYATARQLALSGAWQ